MGMVFSALCCCGATVCGCCCKCLVAAGTPAKSFPKAAYVITDVCFMMIAVMFMFTIRSLAKNNEWDLCPGDGSIEEVDTDVSGVLVDGVIGGIGSLLPEGEEEEVEEVDVGNYNCFGTPAVLRASFVCFCYHVLILIFICPRAHCSSIIHDGFFSGKFIFLLIGFIASFWIPDPFFVDGWANFCRVGSILYLMIQGYFLLNHAYLWNDHLLDAAEPPINSCWAKFLLGGFTLILTIGCSVWIAFLFVWYSGCAIGLITVIITVVFFLFFYVVALLKLCDVDAFRPEANIFVVSFSTLYIVYLAWTALGSHPDAECNANIDTGLNTFMQILVGTIFTVANLWSIAIAAVSKGNKEKKSMGQNIIEEDEQEAQPTTEENKEMAYFPVTFQTMIFQLIMLFASLYFGMLFSNWGHAVLKDEIDTTADNALFSMWVKLFAQWFTMALFIVSVTLYCCDKNKII